MNFCMVEAVGIGESNEATTEKLMSPCGIWELKNKPDFCPSAEELTTAHTMQCPHRGYPHVHPFSRHFEKSTMKIAVMFIQT